MFLVDCGRGVLQRATAAGVGAAGLSALLLTHLHSDHIAELGDLLITRWVTDFAPDPTPLPIIGPPGTTEVVQAMLKAFGHDISYRIAHHADLTAPPPIDVHEYTEGQAWDRDGVTIRVAPPITGRWRRPSDSASKQPARRWCWPATRCRAPPSTNWQPARMRWCTPRFAKTS